MFKCSQSRKFSYRTAATQRDVSNITIKQTYVGPVNVDGGSLKIAFNPGLNFIMSEQGKQYLTMYDQFRFQGFKIKFTPNITGANANYMTYTRWFRDAAPASTYIVPNTDFKAPTGFSPLILLGLRKEVQIVNAQSTQSRYINNNVQNNMYGSIYATDIQGRYRDWETDRKSTRLNSSHITRSRMPSSA